MIDLSFLTEDEQEIILAVLKRDTELKKAEERRVQNLQKSVSDRAQLRYMTGEWFYETKQLRHQDRIHGSDIIRASMRQTPKPLTILELSQLLPKEPSFVSSENKEVFVPPVLCGVLQESVLQVSNLRSQNQNPFETPQDTSKPVLQSPTKQRKNPFNSEVIASHTLEEKDSQLLDRAVDQTQTQAEGPLVSSNSYSSFISDFHQEQNDSPVTQNAFVHLPMHEIRTISTKTQDCFAEVDGPGGRQTSASAPCGILKHLPKSSSSDSLFSHLDTQRTVSLDSPTETKQVRFCPTVSPSRVEWQDGKELGEHSLPDIDSIAPSEDEAHSNLENTLSQTVKPLVRQSALAYQEDDLNCNNEAELQLRETAQHQAFDDVSEHCHSEFLSPAMSGLVSTKELGKPGQLEHEGDCHSQTKAKDWQVGHNIRQFPERSPDISVKATSDAKLPTNCRTMASSHAVTPKPRQRLLGCFKTEGDKSVEVKGPWKEKGALSKQNEPGNTQSLSQGAADMVDKPAWDIQEPTPSVTMNNTTLQLATQQMTLFKETVSSVDADNQQDTTGERIGHLPEKMSNLNASWERQNSSRTIAFTIEEGRQMNNGETEIKNLHGPKTRPDVESINNSGSHQLEMTIKNAAHMFQENKPLSQPDCSLLIDLSEEDGTYRANPILIYEDTGDYLTDLVTESEISEPQENIFTPAPSSKAFLTLDQEWDSPVPFAKLSNTSSQGDSPVKISELRHYWEKEYTEPEINTTIETLSRSILRKKNIFPHPNLRSMDNTENFVGEAKMSPNKTNSSAVLKSLKVSDTETQERPLSPCRPHTLRAKDQNEEVRRSPSKTRHPRVLAGESSSPKTSRPEGSPLKTFPINIDPKSNVTEDHHEKLKPVPRQRKILSHEAKQTMQTGTKHSTNISHALSLNLEEKETCFGNVKSLSSPTSPQIKKASEKTFPHLARTYIPQDYEYYLGPHEKAYVPSFQQEKATDTESDVAHRPKNALRDYVEDQTDSTSGGITPRIGSWIVQNDNENPSQDTTTRANSLSRASPTRYEQTSSPIEAVLRRLSRTSRMSSSKSLESLTLQTREESTKNNSREKMNESVDDASSPPSAFTLSNSKQMKTSVSASVLQDETDSDSIFEASSLRRNTGSSMSNISLSSGMASMSSVSGSISSIYPGDFGDIEVQGSIQFAVNYIQKLGEFQIFVVHCRNLAVADKKKNRSDPYVKCYILPDKTKLGKRKTTVKKKTLNPTYNEILRFKIMMEMLKNQNLNISVWHNDTFGRNSFLGEVDLDLSVWEFRNTQINEYTLKARASAQTSTTPPLCLMDSRGQMRVALRFVTQTSHSKRMARMETGEVQIWVKDCKNLPPVRGVIIDPFVKCTVLPDTSRKNRQKTRVVKRTANPMFNHTMVYNGFQSQDLREACVEMTVWDHDRLNNHYIGGVRLGPGTGKSYGEDVPWMDSTTEEASLWQRMLQSDGEWVEDVLSLRMLAMAKNMSK